MAATNSFPGRDGQSAIAPGVGVFEPVQHDTNQLTTVARALIWKADGTIKYGCLDGSSDSLTAVAGYQLALVQINQIYDTGTDLTNSQITCVK
jgi:hypothetical protein